MKTNFIIIIITILTLNSCSIYKKKHFNGYTVHWNKNYINNENSLANDSILKIDNEKLIIANPKNDLIELEIFKDSNFQKKDTLKCDKLILKNGDEINSKILEISQKEIKYKKCENIDGPLVIVNKSEVFMINYVNGSKEIIKDNNTEEKNIEKRINAFALTGFILSLIGIPILGIIFSGIGLNQIRKNPEKYSGQGLGFAGMVLGIFMLLLIIAITLTFIL